MMKTWSGSLPTKPNKYVAKCILATFCNANAQILSVLWLASSLLPEQCFFWKAICQCRRHPGATHIISRTIVKLINAHLERF